MKRTSWLSIAALAGLFACNGSGCAAARRAVVNFFTEDYKPAGNPADPSAVFEGPDAARPRVDVRLTPVMDGLDQPTDIQFVPGRDVMVVLEKPGAARWKDFASGATGTLLVTEVATDSEEGLLGLAFHPRFAENGRFFTNSVVRVNGEDETHITAWRCDPATLQGAAPTRVVLRQPQPYPNHNAGQLAFGPDGFLYVGLGDGGLKDDPRGNGQNTKTFLGAMLRLDVDREADGKGYAVPVDNPFVGQAGFAPEIWAYGFRNPWRYAFSRDGKLIVADVGQDRFEEIDLVVRGGNYGWNVREARHCFEDEACTAAGFVDPFYEYDRTDGRSITGGYVYAGDAVPALRGKYVFGDFISGGMWAVDVPSVDAPATPMPVTALGKRPILISTFGQDAAGEIYVADFSGGTVLKIGAP